MWLVATLFILTESSGNGIVWVDWGMQLALILNATVLSTLFSDLTPSVPGRLNISSSPITGALRPWWRSGGSEPVALTSGTSQKDFSVTLFRAGDLGMPIPCFFLGF